jgi:hypothetical protein
MYTCLFVKLDKNEQFKTIILIGTPEPALDFAMPCAGKVDYPRNSTPLAKRYTPNIPSENAISANSVTILSEIYVTIASPRLNAVPPLCQSVTTAPPLKSL